MTVLQNRLRTMFQLWAINFFSLKPKVLYFLIKLFSNFEFRLNRIYNSQETWASMFSSCLRLILIFYLEKQEQV
jgi:hypothetical protein